MNRVSLLGLLLACVGSAAPVARAQFIFQRSVGQPAAIENAYDIDRIAAGGYVLVGNTTTSTDGSPQEVFITRTREDGSTIFIRRIGGTNSQEGGFSVRALSDGTFIVAGEVVGAGFPTAAQIFLMRLNSIGNTVWTQRYGGTAFQDSLAGVSVRALRDGGFAVVGRRTGVNGNPLSGVLIRTDSVGTPLFQKIYQVRYTTTNDFGILSFNDLRQMPDGGFVIVGWVDGRQFARPIAPIVIRTDPLGNVIWFRSEGLAGVSRVGDSVDIDQFQKITYSGRLTSVAPPVSGTFVEKLDFNGIPGGGGAFISDFANGIAALEIDDNDPNRVLIGGTYSDPSLTFPQSNAAVVRLNSGLGIRWTVQYGFIQTIERGNGIAIAPCGRGWALAGLSNLPGSVGSGDMYYVRGYNTGRSGCFEDAFIPRPVPIAVTQTEPIFLRVQDQQEFGPYTVQNTFVGSNVIHCLNPTCVADVDDGSGLGEPDGGVGIEDLLYYLTLYDSGDVCADVDDGTGTGTQDGGVGIEDLLYFLGRYDSGC